MRLSARRRGQWPQFHEFLSGDARHILLRGGLVEIIRLGRGEPIVLVPGLAGGWKLLAPLAQRLAQRHEVILYSLRGDCNPFAGPRTESIGDLASDLADVLEHLRLERPTVCAVSFGAAVALQLAVEQPQRFGKLILQGVEARFRPNLGSKITRRVLERFPLPSDSQFLNQFFNLLHGGRPESDSLADFVVRRCWDTDQGVMAQRLRALETFDVSDRLWRIEAPTLVLAGTRDVIVPPHRQRALAEAIPGARFESLDGAGHIGFLTHAADTAQQVGRLLREARRSLC